MIDDHIIVIHYCCSFITSSHYVARSILSHGPKLMNSDSQNHQYVIKKNLKELKVSSYISLAILWFTHTSLGFAQNKMSVLTHCVLNVGSKTITHCFLALVK